MTSQHVDMKVDEIIKDMAEDDVQLVKEDETKTTSPTWRRSATNRPIIRFVNYLIFDAIKQGASDIHIEPKEKALKIRYRIDGILFEAMNPPHTMHAGHRLAPEDHGEPGHLRAPPAAGRPHPRVVHGRKIDLRMSTLPTACGEKVVMRILDNRSINVALEDLGFCENALTIWKNQIDQPHGILLVTGPTGSR